MSRSRKTRTVAGVFDDEVKQLAARKQSLRNDIEYYEKLEREKSEIDYCVKRAQEDLVLAQSELDAVDKEIKKKKSLLKKEVKAGEEKIQSLQTQCLHWQDELKKVQSEVSAAEADFGAIEKEGEVVIEGQQSKIELLEEKALELNEKVSDAEARLKEITSNESLKKEAVMALDKQMAHEQERLDELKKKIELLEGMKKEQSELEDVISAQRESIKNAKMSLDFIDQKISDAEKEKLIVDT